MAKLAVTSYGDALFQLAVESSKCSQMLDEVTQLKQILEANPELADLMANPRFSKEEHLQVIENVFKGKLSEELYNFLNILVMKSRYGELDNILEYFISKVKEYQGIGQAHVKTAIELDAEQKKQIKEKLLSTTKYNLIEIEYEVDPSLIGGMVIRIKDRVVDSSVKSKLERMSRDLHKIQI
ncbi:MAG: F0F1 ATP synthase subunit delta [Lachnospiraceae bacterium]|nr:F0F1 ATP synthase subunit delta [Lachnospiraceae bacterium]